MGVDLGTFRARIGSFAGQVLKWLRSSSVKTLCPSGLRDTIFVLLLILVLLMREGVEQNPGPATTPVHYYKMEHQRALPYKISELGRLVVLRPRKSDQAQTVAAKNNMSKTNFMILRACVSSKAESQARGSQTTSAQCCLDAIHLYLPYQTCPDPHTAEKTGFQPVEESDFVSSSRCGSTLLDSFEHEQPSDGNGSDKKDSKRCDSRQGETGSTCETNNYGGALSSGSSGGDKGRDDDDDEKKRKAKGKEPDDACDDSDDDNKKNDSQEKQEENEELDEITLERSTKPEILENPSTVAYSDATKEPDENEIVEASVDQVNVKLLSDLGQDHVANYQEPGKASSQDEVQRQSPCELDERSEQASGQSYDDLNQPSAQDAEPGSTSSERDIHEHQPDVSETEPSSPLNGDHLSTSCAGSTTQFHSNQAHPAVEDRDCHQLGPSLRIRRSLEVLRSLFQALAEESNRFMTLLPGRIRHLEHISNTASVLLYLMNIVFSRASETTECPERRRSALQVIFQILRVVLNCCSDSGSAAATGSCNEQRAVVDDVPDSAGSNPHHPFLFHPGHLSRSVYPSGQSRHSPGSSRCYAVDLPPESKNESRHGHNDETLCRPAVGNGRKSFETCSPRCECGGRSHLCPSSGVGSWKDCGTDPPRHLCPCPSPACQSHLHGERRQSTSSEEDGTGGMLKDLPIQCPTDCTDDQIRSADVVTDDDMDDDGGRRGCGTNAFPPVANRIQFHLRDPGNKSLVAQCSADHEQDELASGEESDGDVVDMGQIASSAMKPAEVPKTEELGAFGPGRVDASEVNSVREGQLTPFLVLGSHEVHQDGNSLRLPIPAAELCDFCKTREVYEWLGPCGHQLCCRCTDHHLYAPAAAAARNGDTPLVFLLRCPLCNVHVKCLQSNDMYPPSD